METLGDGSRTPTAPASVGTRATHHVHVIFMHREHVRPHHELPEVDVSPPARGSRVLDAQALLVNRLHGDGGRGVIMEADGNALELREEGRLEEGRVVWPRVGRAPEPFERRAGRGRVAPLRVGPRGGGEPRHRGGRGGGCSPACSSGGSGSETPTVTSAGMPPRSSSSSSASSSSSSASPSSSTES